MTIVINCYAIHNHTSFPRELAAILLKRNSVIPPCVLDENSVKNRATLLEESRLQMENASDIIEEISR